MTGGRLLWVRDDLALLALAAPGDRARPATREELLGELGRGGHLVLDRPLTSTDVAAALMADPGLAVQVVDQLRVARAWEPGASHKAGMVRFDLVRSMVPVAIAERIGSYWWWTAGGEGGRGRADSMESAMQLCDAALVAAGWGLAGGAP